MLRRWQYPLTGAAIAAGLSFPMLPANIAIIAGGVLVAAVGGWVIARKEDAVSALGSIDPLTGLQKRAWFEVSLRRELAGAQKTGSPLALVMVELPTTPEDLLTRKVAEAIKRTTRASDLAARWGSDSYVVLAPRTGASQAAALAERISHAVKSTTGLTASVGYAIAAGDTKPLISFWPQPAAEVPLALTVTAAPRFEPSPRRRA